MTAEDSSQIGWLSDSDQQIISSALPFTMTPVERILCLIQAVDYVVDQKIPGDFVECGVWKGGSVVTAALTFIRAGDTSRKIYLYDTFEGMSPPTEDDVDTDGISAAKHLIEQPKNTDNHFWAYAPLEMVRNNVLTTGYPADRFEFVKGKVEETIPGTMPKKISLLRLDTDWYESTMHELVHLYPLLESGGVLILDDYGFWKGAKKAVDQYFSRLSNPPVLHKIDEIARYCTKP
jgi:hypothetical protein